MSGNESTCNRFEKIFHYLFQCILTSFTSQIYIFSGPTITGAWGGLLEGVNGNEKCIELFRDGFVGAGIGLFVQVIGIFVLIMCCMKRKSVQTDPLEQAKTLVFVNGYITVGNVLCGFLGGFAASRMKGKRWGETWNDAGLGAYVAWGFNLCYAFLWLSYMGLRPLFDVTCENVRCWERLLMCFDVRAGCVGSFCFVIVLFLGFVFFTAHSCLFPG